MTRLIIYRGPSLFTREEILGILQIGTKNAKTGDVASVSIVPSLDVARAVRPHPSVCPDGCPLRDRGGCYVCWHYGPNGLQKAHGRKPVATARQVREACAGRVVRLGMVGDPAAVPAHVWRNLIRLAKGWVGYTHAWRERRFRWIQEFCMASVESHVDALRAQGDGWRSYRIRKRGSLTARGELACPSSRGVQCQDCGLCSGSGGKGAKAPSLSIEAHGGAAAARVSNALAR